MKFALEKIRTLGELIRSLAVGLNRLDMVENFESLEKTLVISSGSEAVTRNSLSFIPSKCIIVKKKGNGNIAAGNTADTRDFLYLQNYGPDEVQVTVIWQR